MSNAAAGQSAGPKPKRMLPILSTYWIRGALYIIAIAIAWYFVNPVIGALRSVPADRYSWLAVVAFIAFGPVVAGWFGSKLVNPAIRNWNRIKGVASWEDRIVTELSPDEKRGFPVVLVPWPSVDVKTMGILSNVYDAPDGSGKLASVYLPNTPDPTRGRMHVVPQELLVDTDWSMSDLLRYHMSFGSTGPELVRHGNARED